jgi:DNA modification methylase
LFPLWLKYTRNLEFYSRKITLSLLFFSHLQPLLLDPFAGSGTTLVAACELGINSIGIEREKEYCEIAQKRVEHCLKEQQQDQQMDLFHAQENHAESL